MLLSTVEPRSRPALERLSGRASLYLVHKKIDADMQPREEAESGQVRGPPQPRIRPGWSQSHAFLLSLGPWCHLCGLIIVLGLDTHTNGCCDRGDPACPKNRPEDDAEV